MLFWCQTGLGRLLGIFPGFAQPCPHEHLGTRPGALPLPAKAAAPGRDELDEVSPAASVILPGTPQKQDTGETERNWARGLYFVPTSNTVKNPPGAAA